MWLIFVSPMPFYTKITVSDTILLLWHIAESEGELLQMLPFDKKYREEVYRLFRSTSRRIEWLAVRVLLHQKLGADVALRYDEAGAPYLHGSPLKISISHSGAYVVIALSVHSLGVDLEQWSDKAFRLSARFLDETEQIRLLDGTPQRATVLWSAKEAVFKLLKNTDVKTITDIYLEKNISGNLFATRPTKIPVSCFYYEDFILTLAVLP